jgi:hypothetical protein
MDKNIFTIGTAAMAIIFLSIAGTGNTTIFTTAYSQTSPTLGEPFYIEQTKSTGTRGIRCHSWT